MVQKSKARTENNLWLGSIASNNYNKKKRVMARTAYESIGWQANGRSRRTPLHLPAKQRSAPIPPRYPQQLR
jgi:hypothetical protein